MNLRPPPNGYGPPPERPPSYPDYSVVPYCRHPETEVRVEKHPSAGERCRVQCLTCGAGRGLVAKKTIRSWGGMKRFDVELAARYDAERAAKMEALRDECDTAIARHNRDWWAWYNAYLRTTIWAQKRRQVLERDRHQCAGCMGKATQAHHQTYKRVGNELLCDLFAVCESCHERLHETDNRD